MQFLERMLKYLKKYILKYFFAKKNMKKLPSKVANFQPNFFFQSKSQFMFHKNFSLRNL